MSQLMFYPSDPTNKFEYITNGLLQCKNIKNSMNAVDTNIV